MSRSSREGDRRGGSHRYVDCEAQKDQSYVWYQLEKYTYSCSAEGEKEEYRGGKYIARQEEQNGISYIQHSGSGAFTLVVGTIRYVL